MQSLDNRVETAPSVASGTGLDFVYRLVADSTLSSLSLEALLAQLAQSFGAAASGLMGPLQGASPTIYRVHPAGHSLPPIRWPWEAKPELLAKACECPHAIPIADSCLGSCLLTVTVSPDGARWLFWLEGPAEREWDSSERVTFTLAALALMRWGTTEGHQPLWARPLEQSIYERQFQEAALVTRRLAHDYGNILTGILGFSELAMHQLPNGSPAFRYLEEVRRSGQQAADLTRLLQLIGCRKAMPTQPISLAAVAIEEAVRLRTLAGPGVEVECDIPADLPPVAISKDVLHTLLTQVLDNAREALPGPGSIRLTARPTRLSEAECKELMGRTGAGPCIELCVTDSGSGLSPEVRRNLFARPFYSSKPGHRGLGLAVVYGILQSHRAGFRLAPAPRRGTVVTLYLPLAAVAAPPPSEARASLGEKVMVVDDDPTVLQLIGHMLTSAGYRVLTERSASRALDSYVAAGAEPFLLVLSDVLMPQMTGFDLARQLLNHDAHANVLFMTGHGSPEMAQSDDMHGQFDMLFKPFRPETLLRAVRSALDRGRRVGAGNGGSREESVLPFTR